jgi:hypothetical protein
VKELTAALKIAILDGVFEFLDKLGNHHFWHGGSIAIRDNM